MKVSTYLKGLGWTWLAFVLFAAVGWIQIGVEIEFGKLIVPLLAAVVVWTVMYLLGWFVWTTLALFASCTFGIGFIIGVAALGYAAMQLVAYMLPTGWISFTENEFAFLMMGLVIAIIDLVVDDRNAKGLSVALSAFNESVEDVGE